MSQIEQLQSVISAFFGARTRNVTAPQWQAPLCQILSLLILVSLSNFALYTAPMSKKKNKSKAKAKKKSHRVDNRPPDDALPCQIYLLTPPSLNDVESFAKTLEAVLAAAPIACLQVRLKDMEAADIIAACEILIPLCHQYDTLVIMNDSPELATQTGADGVHLGQQDLVDLGDMNINLAKSMLSEDAIIGITCHNSKELAFKAGSDGADYVAFGAMFESPTKPDAVRAELETLTWWREAIEIPSVAIGGITVDNAALVIDAGADYICLSSGVWDHADGPVKAVQKLHTLCLEHFAAAQG